MVGDATKLHVPSWFGAKFIGLIVNPRKPIAIGRSNVCRNVIP